MSATDINSHLSHLLDRLGIENMEDESQVHLSVGAIRKAISEAYDIAYEVGYDQAQADMDEEEAENEKSDIEKIEEVAEEYDGKVRTNYSGRGMCGRTCYGIVTNDPNSVISAVGIRGACTDSMGLDTIVYWPSVKAVKPV